MKSRKRESSELRIKMPSLKAKMPALKPNVITPEMAVYAYSRFYKNNKDVLRKLRDL